MNSLFKTTINRLATPILRSRKAHGKDLIFLLAHDRSGSTWIGTTMGFPEDVLYVHEPMNEHASNIGNWSLYNQYLPAEAESLAHRKIYDLAVRGLGVRELTGQELLQKAFTSPKVVIKETGGMMLGEWFEKNYGGRIVVLFRHPAPTILSNIKLGEQNAKRWLDQLMSQEKLLDAIGLADVVSRLRACDSVEAFAIVYGIRYTAVLHQLKRNPHWLRLHYEDFCSDPENSFKQLFSNLGLDYSDRTAERIKNNTSRDDSYHFFGLVRKSESQLSMWRAKVDSDMESKIRKILESFNFPFYLDDKSWMLGDNTTNSFT